MATRNGRHVMGAKMWSKKLDNKEGKGEFNECKSEMAATRLEIGARDERAGEWRNRASAIEKPKGMKVKVVCGRMVDVRAMISVT